jgi:hypothetical protein
MSRIKGKCPAVEAQIAEAEQCLAEGKAWCQCVKDDVAKARQRYAEGNCASARYHAVEALKRCTGSKHDLASSPARGNRHRPTTPIDFSPLPPASFDL